MWPLVDQSRHSVIADPIAANALERHVAVENGLGSELHHAHATFAEVGGDL